MNPPAQRPLRAPRPVTTPISGLSLATLALVEEQVRAKQLTHEERAEGRVISPRANRTNFHDGLSP